jgi:hypothetical protein
MMMMIMWGRECPMNRELPGGISERGMEKGKDITGE